MQPVRQTPGGQDVLGRLLADLCTRLPALEDDGAAALREYVEEEARDLQGEAFTRFMDTLFERISALVARSEVADNLGAVRAIDQLIGVQLGENATKISRFANYLRQIFEEKGDPAVMVAASVALGHLAREGGALTADVVEFQVKRALEWLQGERVESKRFAAVLILKEMAENAPTVFNVHIPVFIDAIWSAMRDPKLEVRLRAVDALRACLCVIEKRETRWRVQGYYRMFEETQKGLNKNASVESIHGSLLAIGELLRNTGEFMMARYKEVAQIVLNYRDHRERLVRRSITALLPRIAYFLRDRFVASYLKVCMEHLLGVMRNPAERTTGFAALGEMAGAVGPALTPYLPAITPLLREAIAPSRRGRPCPEALACVGQLAQAVGPDYTEHARSLLEPLFQGGLSPILVESLAQIASSLPVLLPSIQERLLDVLSLILAKKPYRPPSAASPLARSPSLGSPVLQSELTAAGLTQLALRTLATFDLSGHDMIEFVREHVVRYLDDDEVHTRREAAVTCCRLLKASVAGAGLRLPRDGRPLGSRRKRVLVEEVLERLLVAAVADADEGVRRAVLLSLPEGAGFEENLAQADSLRAVFIALNDESFEVRQYAITLAGQLAERNPAYVLPALRRHLLQLLTDLEHSSDSKHKQESARLLGCLVHACPRLILPYIAPVLKALVAQLRESSTGGAATGETSSGGGRSGVITHVLATVGELARVGGGTMRPYVGELMPLVVDALHDGGTGSDSKRRQVAVCTLGQLVESTGYVVVPYTDFPQLLGVLLRLLNGEQAWAMRHEVLKVLGVIGALDPHAHKRNQMLLQAGHAEGGRPPAPADGGMARSALVEADLPGEVLPSSGMSTSSEEYYPTVAINALMRILREKAMSSYHQRVVGSLMYIFRAMGLACVPYLPKVLPDLFHVMTVCDDALRDFLLRQLAQLVAIVRQHIRKYLPELLNLIHEYWSYPALLLPVLHLVEQLSRALNDEFRAHLPEILPRCVQVLALAEQTGDYASVPPVLHAFEVFGSSMDEHMHLVLPALVRLLKPSVVDAPVEIRRATIRTLGRLLPTMHVAGHASAILHPLTRVLDGPQEELRKDAMDAICALAGAMGSDFAIFIPSIRKLLHKHRLTHPRFEGVAARVLRREPAVVLEASSLMHAPSDASSLSEVYHGARQADGESVDGEDDAAMAPGRVLRVNEGALRRAWESSQRSTREDWAEWMRHFSVELLKESPSPALRTCAGLAQLQPHVARELFAAGFVSCWSELSPNYREQLVRSLEAAFASPTIPPEILATLLNLAEFMEHDEKPLPMEIRTLGALAEKCHAFAKALHYKEREFETSPTTTVEALIHINNQLHQHEAAVGILHYAQQQQGVELKESWYEELQRWDEALEAYELKAAQAQTHHQALEATLGRMRCLAALARWDELGALCRETWAPAEPAARLEMAPMAASAAWNLNEWDEMHEYVSVLDDGDDAHRRMPMNAVGGSRGGSVGSGISDGPFFRAVLSVRRGQYADARMYVERARKLLATELAALVLESYERAYGNMVRVQQLAELEEVIDYCQLPTADAAADARAALIRRMWQDRVRGAQRNVEVWQALLAVRSLVLPPSQDIATWLKFASLCRKSGRVSQSQATLVKLLQYDPAQEGGGRLSVEPPVMLAYLKHQWSLGGDRNRMDAFHQMQELAGELEHSAAVVSGAAGPQSLSASALMSGDAGILVGGVPILARIYLKLGTWRWTLSASLDDDAISGILSSLAAATESARGWAKAWHKWALFNTAVMSHHTVMHNPAAAARHVVAAVNGYFRSIALGSANQKGGDGSLQDILRLLTLWFNHGAATDVQAALQEGFQQLNIDTWLVVIPQIIARIHSPVPAVRNLIQALLTRVGRHHPQALMYPLLVACKSMSSSRKQAAQAVVDNVRNHSATLVKQAQLVSKELIRMAILWHEMWHEALEEASRLYFGEHNVEGMLQALEPLHAMMDKQGAETLKEISFGQAYGRELQEAHECCMRFRRTGKEAEITQAWDLYYNVFKRINKQLPSLTTLELQYVSPALVQARNLELAVPGTYRAGAPVVTIASFAAQLTVITSKQRPRKCTIYGSDGVEYTFLLKGHEDLRQDERVMQLFGLVNTLLANARQSAELDLAIQRYSVIPLSPNSGLIGWVPNCDTLHQLIREYRDQRKVPVNHEHRLMLQFAPDYDALPLMAKVEVFEHALDNTSGNDLNKVLWLKSRSSEVWLDRRTNYTRSLAVMSMVGYLLGLGDRHPSNLMLDRYSGKIIHIDFGDCFEASMNREKFPERVPFRLTRMLVKAMEVSGIEGNFRSTCENVMTVLRQNKDSVMAMMEAFVHDPLINWRLFHLADGSTHPTGARGAQPVQPADEQAAPPSPPQRGAREKELREAVGQLGDANEVLNERAVAVMTRMSNKLTGRDFGVNGVPPIGAAGVPGAAGAASSYLLASSGIGAPGAEREEPGLTVKVQVQKLIAQAMSHENLCQSYIGWCPFW